MALEIYLLGQFKLKANQLPIELPSRPAQSLLAYLALNAGATLRREKLASLLWAEATETNARGYLRQALWRIRKSLQSASLPWEEYLQISEISVSFKSQSDYWLDVDQLLKPAEGRPLEEISAEIRLYRGELLPGFYDGWVGLERDRLETAYYRKMNYLLEQLIQARRWDETLKWAEQWISQGYSPEPAYRALMKAYAGLGNPGMVSATYQRCIEALERELGVGPSPETTRLYEQVRRGQLEEIAAPKPSTAERTSQPPRMFDREEPLPIERPLVVARERELKRMHHGLSQALSGQGRVIFVTGEAGSGKTTLVNEFARRAQGATTDLIIASGNCNAHTGIGDPYLPFREILALLTGDVEARWSAGAITREYARFLWNLIPVTVQALMDAGPDLIDAFLPGPALLERAMAYSTGEADWLARLERLLSWKQTDQATQNRHQSDLFIQFSKFLQTLSLQAPVVLVVDDLQWADLGSLSLLFHLGRQLAGNRILIIGAYRPEEIALGRAGERHPLEPVVNELRRVYGDIEINVDQVESRIFIDALLDSEPNKLGRQFREKLGLLTRGHPLFTIELLRGMQERGDLLQDENGHWVEGPTLDWEALPARVEAVIAERVGRLDAHLQATLRAASVEGEVFTAEALARVQGRDESEILAYLSNELDRRHRLISAQSIQRIAGQLLSNYRFRHSLVHKYLYNSMNAVERVHLHERVGMVLEELYASQVGAVTLAPQLARHFREARIADKAIHYLQLSGERAMQVFAYQEALAHLEQGLSLLASLPDPDKYAQQELSLQLALSMVFNLAMGFIPPEMENAAVRALELCQRVGNQTQLCQVLSVLSILFYVRGEYQAAYDYAKRELQLGQQTEDPLLVALGHWSLGITCFARGEYQDARDYLEQVVSFYEAQQHHRAFVVLRGVDVGLSSMAYLACCLWCLGYPEQAWKRNQEVLDLAFEIDHSFTLADVLRYGDCEFHKIRRDAEALKDSADALVRLSLEKEFPAWQATGAACQGEALILLGRLQDGMPLIQEGVTDQLARNVRCYASGFLLILAEAYARMGEPAQGLAALDDAFTLIEQTGERHMEAEGCRLRAALQLQQGEEGEAEASLQQALELARQQHARWWELRAALDLARLWQKQGKTAKARQVVQEVYGWFTEGFDTPEMEQARALLEELA